MDESKKAGTESATGEPFQRPTDANCLKEWYPDLAANPIVRCLCPRCFPFSFAAVQAEILQRAFSRESEGRSRT